MTSVLPSEDRTTADPASAMKVSVCVICKDEAHNIEACLQSVSWADEIIVVDSGSTDGTVEIARRFTPNVIFNEWPGYVAQKNFALSRATGDWVFALDADERCTPELEKEIREILCRTDGVDGYLMRRHTWYLGKWINHSGWYPDWKLRLVREGRARWGGTDPHDRLEVEGKTVRLKGKIRHFTYRSFADHVRTINKFSDSYRDEAVKAGRRAGFFTVLVRPWLKFIEIYIWKLGFLDGRAGFIIAIGTSFYVFARSVKLWERGRPPSPEKRDG